MESELVDTWMIHCRITLYLLDALNDDGLMAKPAGGKGRSVAENFAHMNNVRLMWLQSAAPGLMVGLDKIEKDQAASRELLRERLTSSALAIATLIEQGLAAGRIRGFRPHPVAFAGYLVSHESHHRGEIELTLTQAGFKLDQKVSYGLWEWGVR